MGRRRLLVTGASGLLGWHLCRYCVTRGWDVTGSYCARRPELPGVRLLRMDLSQRDSISRSLCGLDLNAVIHAAAMTHPDECEAAPERTRAINVAGTENLLAATSPNVRLVYVSTDLVFDGRQGHYSETDLPNPLNAYARSKLEAEGLVLRRSGAITVRMALLYAPPSPFRSGFVGWMRSRLEQGQRVPLFVDQIRSPVYVGDVARALEILLEEESQHRLYHLGGAERLTRTQFGEMYSRLLGYDASLIEPVLFETTGLAARGRDCSLCSERFAEEFKFRPGGLLDGLERMKRGVY